MARLTASYIFDHLIPQFIEDHPEFARKVDAVLSVSLEGQEGGEWTIDMTECPQVYRGLSDRAKCTLIMSVEDFHDLLENGGLSDWLRAFKQRKIHFKGHLPTALRLERLFVAMGKDQAISEYGRRVLAQE